MIATATILILAALVIYGANPLARYLHRTNPTRLAAEALDERDFEANVNARWY